MPGEFYIEGKRQTIDLSEIRNGLTQLQAAGGQLRDAVSEIQHSVSELSSAITEVQAAVTQVQDTINEVQSNISELQDAITQIQTAIVQVQDAVSEVYDDTEVIKPAVLMQLSCVDFWSSPAKEIVVGATASNISLPSVSVAGLPTGAIVRRAVIFFKFRIVENTADSDNKLSGSQFIQVGSGSIWLDAVGFVNEQFSIAGTTREGGDVFIGNVDVSALVNGNGTYSLRWASALASANSLKFCDIQTGIRVWYSAPSS
ncbi:MAG: hypothetical protein N3E40_05435 [Dehalococcoidia bacterium]|nr:hypothetical protein [Dehalococcoidia bacterium]